MARSSLALGIGSGSREDREPACRRGGPRRWRPAKVTVDILRGARDSAASATGARCSLNSGALLRSLPRACDRHAPTSHHRESEAIARPKATR
jgi:hypothetical protein